MGRPPTRRPASHGIGNGGPGRWLILGALVSLLVLGRPAAAAPSGPKLLVSAATSLRAAMAEAARAFEARSGATVALHTGASGALLAQIEHGAAVDLFVSASPAEMDRLEQAALLVAGSRRTLAENRLVVVVPTDAAPLAALADLSGPRFQRLAIGNPNSVPAGRYAEESLRAAGIWQPVEPRLVLAEHVRQALDWVTRGECDAAVVYATDVALVPGRVRAAFAIPAASHSPILYQGAVVAGGDAPALARALLDFLSSPEGIKILTRHGFLPPRNPPRRAHAGVPCDKVRT